MTWRHTLIDAKYSTRGLLEMMIKFSHERIQNQIIMCAVNIIEE